MIKDELKLIVGTPMQLELLTSHRRFREPVKCIGYVPGQSILLMAPQDKGSVLAVAEGEEVALRYLDGDSVCGFKTAVQRVCREPFAYMHLIYPSSVERVRVRKAERVAVDLTVRIKRDEGAAEGVGAVLNDLSVAGAGVRAAKPLGRVGDRRVIEGRFEFAGMGETVEIPVIIRNVVEVPDPDGTGKACQHGVEFIDVSAPNRLLIQGFIYERMIGHRS